MVENLNFPELIEGIFLKEDNLNRRVNTEETIELLWQEYWNGDNIWLKEKWKEFRELDGNNMMFDLKSGFRKFKSLLQEELELGFDEELLEKGIVKVSEDGVYFIGFSEAFNPALIEEEVTSEETIISTNEIDRPEEEVIVEEITTAEVQSIEVAESFVNCEEELQELQVDTESTSDIDNILDSQLVASVEDSEVVEEVPHEAHIDNEISSNIENVVDSEVEVPSSDNIMSEEETLTIGEVIMTETLPVDLLEIDTNPFIQAIDEDNNAQDLTEEVSVLEEEVEDEILTENNELEEARDILSGDELLDEIDNLSSELTEEEAEQLLSEIEEEKEPNENVSDILIDEIESSKLTDVSLDNSNEEIPKETLQDDDYVIVQSEEELFEALKAASITRANEELSEDFNYTLYNSYGIEITEEEAQEINVVDISDCDQVVETSELIIEDIEESEEFSSEEVQASPEAVLTLPVIIDEEVEEVEFILEDGEINSVDISPEAIENVSDDLVCTVEENSDDKKTEETSTKPFAVECNPLVDFKNNVFLDGNYGTLAPTISQALGNFGIKNPFPSKEEKAAEVIENINSAKELHTEETSEYNPENPETLTFADHLPESQEALLEDAIESEEKEINNTEVLIAEDNGFEVSQVIEEEIVAVSEEELFPILSQFIRNNHNFNAYSKSMSVPENTWNHPAIVALGGDICNECNDELFTEFAGSTQQDLLKIYSFNVKGEVSLGNMREYFFQSVSNSNWANEGYLVLSSIVEENNRFIRDELKRLSAFYGIGVILLDVENAENSEIISLSEARMKLDMNFINKLISNSTNTDFRDFIANINEIKKNGELNKDFFDKISTNDEKSNSELKYLTNK